jgi:tetratricopeptide (TPR) repeat protein
VHAVEESSLHYVVGPYGVGKSLHIRAAIRELAGQGRFAQVFPTTSGLAPQELERALRRAHRGNRLLVGLDKPMHLRPTELSLLVEKTREDACVVFVECTSRERLAEPLLRLGLEIGAKTHTIEPLTETEVLDFLTDGLGAPVVLESVHLLWYRTGGNQELIARWVSELLAAGRLSKGHYAWYWPGWDAPTPSVVQYVREKYERLSWTKQQLMAHLTIAGSIPHDDLVHLGHEADLTYLWGCGLIKYQENPGLPVSVRLSAPVWGDVIRGLLPRGRRQEIFSEARRPSAGQHDHVAALSWARTALEDGHPMTDSELLVAIKAASAMRRWHLIEDFVAVRLPHTMPPHELIAQDAERDHASRAARISMLVERAMAYQRQSKFQAALADLHLARELVALDPASLSGLVEEILLVESAILRWLPDGERERADTANGSTADVRPPLFPAPGTDLAAYLVELEQLLEHDDGYSQGTLSVLPQVIYLLGLSGQLGQARRLCEHALEASSLQAAQPTHSWITADIVSAWFTVSLWSGGLASGMGVKDVEKMARLFDSAALHTSLGRVFAAAGQWENAWRQYSGALERYTVTDPFGQRKLALAGYAQALAALGRIAEAVEAIGEYDRTPYLNVAVLASDTDYLVLMASYAVGSPDFPARLEDFMRAAQRDEHWFSMLRGAHLGVVVSSGATQRAYLRVLEQAAGSVESDVGKPYILDAWALVSGTPTEVVRTRSALAQRGVWVPGPQV